MKVKEFVSKLCGLEPELELVFFDGTVPRVVEAVERTELPAGEQVVVWLGLVEENDLPPHAQM